VNKFCQNKTMKHIFSVGLLALLLTGSLAQAQITEDPEDRRASGRDQLKTTTPEGNPLPFSQRLRFGGGIGPFSLGNNVVQLGVSPVIAYNATEHLILGVGLSYIYTRYNRGNPYTFVGATGSRIGGRAFAMYEVVPALVPNLYLHGEIESTNVSTKFDDTSLSSASYGYTAPLVGVTYMQPISRRFGVNLTALYNLNYSSSGAAYALYNGTPLVLRVAFF
jgi:hypothetical protein